MSTAKSSETYKRLLAMISSGRFAPGVKLAEETLAADLGVSRAPVRETLRKLVGQGLLVGGSKGQGVRMREYSIEDIRQLYEYREVLEGVAAASAAQRATEADLTRLEILCDQQAAELEHIDKTRWADLECRFHLAVAEASHNQRVHEQLQLLITECRYVFFLLPSDAEIVSVPKRVATSPSQRLTIDLEGVYEEHANLFGLIRSHQVEEAEAEARRAMRDAARRVTRDMINAEM